MFIFLILAYLTHKEKCLKYVKEVVFAKIKCLL